ncbi:hypothetical protein K3G39_06950 [Pontibacter sp. HSC-14F20]|uniref:hypothetical protein n=1 Tax=Pontibacter sp. HSC-14F20 TaxID=2864136 RepID=UPI001C72F736|nr:hypothetical protein [Pontibacter sp. HSC-14F20]MBX0332971.1 hypothetical protein [Pontibacter sp. HSC-14F20]
MCREKYLNQPLIKAKRYVYHISPAVNRDSIDRLGILSRNDIRFGPKFGYPDAVFANNLDVFNSFFWWPFIEEMWEQDDPNALERIYDIWEIDTRIVNTTWRRDPGLFKGNRHIFTLDDIPREAIRLVRQEPMEQRIRYSDGVASTYTWNGLVTVLPRRPRYRLPCVR